MLTWQGKGFGKRLLGEPTKDELLKGNGEVATGEEKLSAENLWLVVSFRPPLATLLLLLFPPRKPTFWLLAID
jgi:hypothetical protein